MPAELFCKVKCSGCGRTKYFSVTSTWAGDEDEGDLIRIGTNKAVKAGWNRHDPGPGKKWQHFCPKCVKARTPKNVGM